MMMMRHILRRNNLCTLSAPHCSNRFSSAPPLREFSSSPSPSPPQADEQNRWRDANVSVWWDVDSCKVPSGVDVANVPTAVEKALLAHEIEGPRSITAFGDLSQLSGASHEALSASGIQLTHLSKGSFVDQYFFNSIAKWVHQNPAPGHVLLFSGNKQFRSTLDRLRWNFYNVLLASPPGESFEFLSDSAATGWEWSALLEGEVTGKSFRDFPSLDSSEYTKYEGDLFAPAKLLFRPDHERRSIVSLEWNKKKIGRYLKKQKEPMSLEVLRRKLDSFGVYVLLSDVDFATLLGTFGYIEVSTSEDHTLYASIKPSELDSSELENESWDDFIDTDDEDSDDSAEN